MKMSSSIMLSVLILCCTQLTLALAEESGGGPKMPTTEICGRIVWSANNQPTGIEAESGSTYSLDPKSRDIVEEYHEAHPESRASVPRAGHLGLRPRGRDLQQPRWCLEGALIDSTLQSAEVISVSAP